MKTLQQDFKRFLETGGYCTPPGRAACALNSARTLERWREAESAGLVRLQAEPEPGNYFDVYGEPNSRKKRNAIADEIKRVGCWCVYSQVNHGSEAIGNDWRIADSIGFCIYDDPLCPFENPYVIGLMDKALSEIPQPGNVDELCTSIS